MVSSSATDNPPTTPLRDRTPTREDARGDGTGRRTPSPRRAKLATPRSVLNAVLVLVLAYLVLPPVVIMVWKSFVDGTSLDGVASFSAYQHIAGSDLGVATVDTLEFALGTTVVSIVIGTLLAWIAARTDAPLRWLSYVVAFVGLAVPGIVNVVGWILLFGNGKGQGDEILSWWFGRSVSIGVESLPGMIFVESLLSIPIVFFLMVGPLQNFNSALEEAASVFGARNWKVTVRITAPLMVPTLASAILLIVIRSMQAFEVPVLLGVPAGTHIFTAELYETLHGSLLPDYSGAAAYGTILVIALVLLVGAENRLTRDARKYAVVTGRSNTHTRRRLRRTKYLPAVLAIVLLLCYLLPTVYLVYASFEPNLSGSLSLRHLTAGNYAAMWRSPGFSKAVVDTLIVAIATALATVLVTLASAWVSARSNRLPARLVTLMANAPLVVPGVVFGFGFLLFYLYSPVPLFGTLWAIILAFVALYLPYGMRTLRPAIIGISTELEEAARVSGARERGVARRILLPLVAPSAAGTGLFVFFNAFRELAVAALLITAATPMLSTQLLDALVNGDLNVVSALGTFIMAVTVVIGAIGFRVVGFRRGAGQLSKGVG
jgi:iron(III) transport system permease protein